MIPDTYVWLLWSCSFLVPWLALCAAFPRYREAMGWSSIMALPFGMTEPLFLGRYWDPPTLFDLARKAHFDLETFPTSSPRPCSAASRSSAITCCSWRG